jgi:hypothetical protein
MPFDGVEERSSKSKDKFWTDAREKELEALWEKGYSASLIAGFLGTTKNAVIGKAYRIPLPPRRVRIHNQPIRRTRGKGITLRPKPAPSQPRANPRQPIIHDFSWHIDQIARQSNSRNIKPPPGLASWRTFERTAENSPSLRARSDAAKMQRKAQRSFG